MTDWLNHIWNKIIFLTTPMSFYFTSIWNHIYQLSKESFNQLQYSCNYEVETTWTSLTPQDIYVLCTLTFLVWMSRERFGDFGFKFSDKLYVYIFVLFYHWLNIFVICSQLKQYYLYEATVQIGVTSIYVITVAIRHLLLELQLEWIKGLYNQKRWLW